MEKDGKKFRSLEVRGKLIALKNGASQETFGSSYFDGALPNMRRNSGIFKAFVFKAKGVSTKRAYLILGRQTVVSH